MDAKPFILKKDVAQPENSNTIFICHMNRRNNNGGDNTHFSPIQELISVKQKRISYFPSFSKSTPLIMEETVPSFNMASYQKAIYTCTMIKRMKSHVKMW